VCVCVCVCVCVFDCIFAYRSRTGITIYTKLNMLTPCDQEEASLGQNSEKLLYFLSCEVGSCSSETKQDRRMAPREKLLVSKSKL
jgi:hypothetical protein